METISSKKLDTADLEQKVKNMYKDVALHPEAEYHFEMGRGLAEKLGYDKADLDRIPAASIDSFAGVGYYFDMACIGGASQQDDYKQAIETAGMEVLWVRNNEAYAS